MTESEQMYVDALLQQIDILTSLLHNPNYPTHTTKETA